MSEYKGCVAVMRYCAPAAGATIRKYPVASLVAYNHSWKKPPWLLHERTAIGLHQRHKCSFQRLSRLDCGQLKHLVLHRIRLLRQGATGSVTKLINPKLL